MSNESLTATWQRLNVSTEAMAALGAVLKLRQENASPNPQIKALLEEVVCAIDPDLLKDVTAQGDAATLGFIQSFFRQAVDLLENPARSPGWAYEDPFILQSMGQASRMVVGVIAALAKTRPSLQACLDAPGHFLDVGTGVAWLAIEAAKTWPKLKIVGIDPFEPALALAHRNVAATQMQHRVELRQQSVEDLDVDNGYNVTWLAGPFIPADVMKNAMPHMFRATASGGTFIFGLFATPPNPLAQALLKLKVTRNGGHPWTPDEAKILLEQTGFVDIEFFAPPGPTQLIVGRKPS